MKINRNNYEEFFIDYNDKNLSAEQVAELFLFLESNPDLKEEFYSFGEFSLEIPVVEFPHRDEMKRGEINKDNFNWYMSASVEGDLSTADQKLLDNFLIKNPQYSNDIKLFQKAKLEAGSEIFPNKKSLKQPVPFVINYKRTINYAIAAMLFISLIGGGYFLFTKSQVQQIDRVAELPVELPLKNNEVQTPSQPDSHPTGAIPYDAPTEKIQKENQLAATQQLQKNEPANERLISPKEESNPVIIEEQPLANETNPEKDVATEPVAINNAPDTQTTDMNAQSDDEEYVSVWKAVQKGAEKNLRKAIKKEDDYTLADGSDDKPIRILDVVSKGVEKLSKDKVTVDAAYADNGKVSGFRFAAGKFSIEKNNPE